MNFLPPPQLRVYMRILPNAAVAFFLMWLVMGFIANSDPYIKAASEHLALAPRVYPVGGLPWEAAAYHAQQTLDYLIFFPEACRPGRQINDFQVDQCKKFKDVLADYLGLFILPWIVTFFLAAYLKSKAALFYRHARRALRDSEPSGVGVVTHPPHLPPGWLGWLYCIQALSVQLPQGEQRTVWMSSKVQLPQPGQKVALYSVGKEWGKERWIGVFYAPHVAVFSSRF